MITFTDKQIESLSPEEKEMLNDLAKRHRVEVPDHYEEERKRLEEEQKKMKEHIEEHFRKEKENEDYAKWMESQLDTNGAHTTTQFF
ncbi:MAG: hypothetical protein IKX65_08435 [Prevotella sp.]|jgi:hypothetical protein|nr:hypothetical protein [Prevotella sp.]